MFNPNNIGMPSGSQKPAGGIGKSFNGPAKQPVQPLGLGSALFGAARREKTANIPGMGGNAAARPGIGAVLFGAPKRPTPAGNDKKPEEKSRFADKYSVKGKDWVKWAEDTKRYKGGWHASTKERTAAVRKQLDILGIKENQNLNRETARKYYKDVMEGKIVPENIQKGSQKHKDFQKMVKGFMGPVDRQDWKNT